MRIAIKKSRKGNLPGPDKLDFECKACRVRVLTHQFADGRNVKCA